MALWLDIGHGGSDPGAKLTGGVTERDELRSVLGDAVSYLSQAGYVQLVPSLIPLRDRVFWLQQRATRADAVISLHLDSAASPEARGVTVFHREDLLITTGAHDLADMFARAVGSCSRGARVESLSAHSRLAIVSGGDWHGYLLECGFLTNPDDLARFRERGAFALVATICSWTDKR